MAGIEERLKKELAQFVIGDESLDAIFEPLIAACRKVAKTDDELKRCIIEGISTLKQIVKSIK